MHGQLLMLQIDSRLLNLSPQRKNPNKGTCKRIMVSLKFDWFDLAYQTENEDAQTRSMQITKNRNIFFHFFLSKCANRSLFTETFVKEKEKCWYHKNQNSNSKVLHYYNFSVNTFDQLGLSSHATQSNTISPRSRISTSSNNERHFFFFLKLAIRSSFSKI